MTKSIEPIILAVALGLLAIGAATLAYIFPSLQDITGIVSTEPTNRHPLKKLVDDDLKTSLAAWNNPVLWQAPNPTHRLFISDDFLFYASLYPTGNYIQKNDGSARTPGGVLVKWYQDHGMDFTDPNIDHADPDNDGFSNKVEFMNEQLKASEADGTKSTNPLDAKSHPSYLSRFRLQKFTTRPFHIQFKGYQELNGERLFQIFLSDVPSSRQPGLKKAGDDLGYEGYKVGAFVQKIVDEVDPATGLKSPVDESTIELIKPDIDLHVIIPFRKVIDSPESTADFVMLMPSEASKVIRVARGKTFTMPFVPEVTYILISTSDTGAVIRDAKTKEDVTVPKLTPAEWNDVPQAPAAAPK